MPSPLVKTSSEESSLLGDGSFMFGILLKRFAGSYLSYANGGDGLIEMGSQHQQRLSRLLIGYRFFAFCLAVIVLQVIPGPDVLDQQEYIILSLVGVYTLLKVCAPLRWEEAAGGTYVVLAGDLTVVIVLVLFTRGIDSGYLMYSFTPLITAALLMDFRVALFVATVTVLTPFVAHGALSQFMDNYAWLLDGNRLPVLLLYAGLGLLIPVMANRTNLNIRRFIEIDAVLESAAASAARCMMAWPRR